MSKSLKSGCQNAGCDKGWLEDRLADPETGQVYPAVRPCPTCRPEAAIARSKVQTPAQAAAKRSNDKALKRLAKMRAAHEGAPERADLS
jgi:hypothetical protein